jgi:arylsulfatase A-like enzyme
MKTARLLFWPLLCSLFSVADLRAADATRPNILLIYSDDHGWADLGIQKADPNIQTPNIDQLARDGVRFTRGYVSAPQCVPSRAGLLSGRYQQRFGVEDNTKGPLPLGEITIAERLKSAGYVTGQVGKWHLDLVNAAGAKKDLKVDPGFFPHKQGFDEYWRGEMKQFFASHDLAGKPFPDAPHLVKDERFRVLVQTDAALSFLDRRSSQPGNPWFLYLAWYAPHVPLDSPEPWFSKTPKDLPRERRMALSMIAAMDDGLGRIRAKLREMGQEQNTLIFLISDNGAPLGDSWNGSLNLPMRGQKGMLSEGGIRVPFVAAWPGTLPSGGDYEHPVINLDVAATAVALSGQPADPTLDGVNLMPFLKGERKEAPHKRLFWRWGSQAAVLEYPYKLIRLGDRERMLFDVTVPEGEHASRNLLSQKPQLAARLEERLREWAADLTPPGLPETLDKHHETLFSEHEISARAEASLAKARKAEAGSAQGWVCRNGTLSTSKGGLVIAPDPMAGPNVRAFITNSDLEVRGPVKASLRVRTGAGGGGVGSVTWRTKSESFTQRQVVSFQWPASGDWETVELELPEKETIIHVRVSPPRTGQAHEVQAISLKGEGQEGRNWAFEFPK